MRRIWIALFVLALIFAPMALAQEESLCGDVVILYTNDVHSYIDKPLSYDVIGALKADLQQEYAHVILADAGDHIQGTAYGAMDAGENIIAMMNAAGYDVATLGNHEFDFGMDGCMNVLKWAEYPYVACNFYNEEDHIRNDNVLDSYVIFDCGAQKVAFLGIITPEVFTQSAPPAYFQDESGEYIYGFSGGEDGKALYADVQAAIDGARADGATTVIALGHLGTDGSSGPWASTAVIANTSGLDAFIDAHSHSVVKGEMIPDQEGGEVLLTQTGEYFSRIGMMVIDDETGAITSDFIEPIALTETITNDQGEQEETVIGYELSSELYDGTILLSDPETAQIKDAWIRSVDEQLLKKIGITALTFDNYAADGSRLVRRQETNTGDLAADALYWLFDQMDLDVDVAVMNGGGIRNAAITGEITFKDCKQIHPYGNVACLQTVSGQQLLDALEWGARCIGTEVEMGAFLQVSGVTYTIDTSWPDSTLKDDRGAWISGPTGGYRVKDVKVYNRENDAWEDLDLNASYNLAGYNYILRDLGDGFAMFDGAVNVLDYVMEDYMVLANYVQAFDGGEIQASNSPLMAKYPGLNVDYGTVNGSGRIQISAAE